MRKSDKTRVRRYEARDVLYLVKIIGEEVPKLPNYKGVVVDPERVRFLLQQNLNNDGYFAGFLLVTDPGDVIVGGIAAYCVTLVFSWDRLVGDMFLFIRPEWRTLPNATKLVKAYIDWGKARKAAIITASHTGGTHETGMDLFLKGMDFQPIGKLYHYRRP